MFPQMHGKNPREVSASASHWLQTKRSALVPGTDSRVNPCLWDLGHTSPVVHFLSIHDPVIRPKFGYQGLIAGLFAVVLKDPPANNSDDSRNEVKKYCTNNCA